MKKYQLFSKAVQAFFLIIGKPMQCLLGKRTIGTVKDSGLTAHIERFNGTLIQRAFRLLEKP